MGVPPANDSPKTPSKRPAESASSPVNGKRARTISPSQRRVDSYFSSPKKSVEKAAAIDVDLPTETQTGYLLSIKDHKTRNRPFLPSDSDMSDDAMLALEPALAQAFRAHATSSSSSGNTKKQQTKDARQNITAFKNRVLDLLEIFVRQRASSALCTLLICPLLECMRTTSVKQIADRCGGLLRVYFDFAKKGRGGKDASAAASSINLSIPSIKSAASIKAKISFTVTAGIRRGAFAGAYVLLQHDGQRMAQPHGGFSCVDFAAASPYLRRSCTRR